MTLDVTFVDLKPQPAATLTITTTHANIPADLEKAYNTLGQYVQSNKVEVVGPPFAIYGDMDGEQWIVTVGMPVAAPITAEGDVKPGATPAGRAAQTLHTGPYHTLSATWQAFEQWSKANDQQLGTVGWESYIDDPDTTDPAELKTLLYWHV